MADAKKAAFRAVAHDETAALADVLKGPEQEWSKWTNEAGQTLLALCKQRGSFKSYALLAKAMGISTDSGKLGKEDPSTRAFRAAAQDDMAALAEILGGLSVKTWLKWRNKAGKDLLTMSLERNKYGAYAVLKKALVSPLPAGQEMKQEANAEAPTAAVEAEQAPSPAAAVKPAPAQPRAAAEPPAVQAPAAADASAEEAEEDARKKAEEESRRKTEEDAKNKAEEEARKAADEQARKKAAEEAEAKLKSEEEARRKAEEEARMAEEEAKKKAEEEAKKKAEEEAKKKAEEEAKKKALEEEKRKAEEQARQKAEEDAKKKAQEEEKKKAARLAPPPTFEGGLKKKGKGGMFRKAWDQRHIVVKDKTFSWFRQKSDVGKYDASGVVNLVATACEVVPDPTNATYLTLRPQTGNWVGQDFKGADDGREFVFDTAGSEHSRESWLKAITLHCEFAQRK